MLYKYNNGYQEINITDVNEIIYLLQTGKINMETALLDAERGVYRRVRDIPEVQYALQQMNGNAQSNQGYNGAMYTGPMGGYQNSYTNRPQKKSHLALGIIIGIILLAATAAAVYFNRESLGLVKDSNTTVAERSTKTPKSSKETTEPEEPEDKKTQSSEKTGIQDIEEKTKKPDKPDKEIGKSKSNEETLKLAAEKLLEIYRDAESDSTITGQEFDEEIYGEYTEALEFTNEFLVELYQATNKIKNDLEQYNLEQLISEATMNDINKIIDARKQLQAVGEDFDNFEITVNDIIEQYSAKAETLEIPSDFKAGFLAGFQKSKDEDLPRIKELFEIEAALIEKVDEILGYLEQRQGKYKFQNGQVTFNTQADVNGFNKLGTELNELIEKEAEWQQKTTENTQKSIDSLEKAIDDMY